MLTNHSHQFSENYHDGHQIGVDSDVTFSFSLLLTFCVKDRDLVVVEYVAAKRCTILLVKNQLNVI